MRRPVACPADRSRRWRRRCRWPTPAAAPGRAARSRSPTSTPISTSARSSALFGGSFALGHPDRALDDAPPARLLSHDETPSMSRTTRTTPRASPSRCSSPACASLLVYRAVQRIPVREVEVQQLPGGGRRPRRCRWARLLAAGRREAGGLAGRRARSPARFATGRGSGQPRPDRRRWSRTSRSPASKVAAREAGAGLPPTITAGHAGHLGEGQRGGRRRRLRRARHPRRRGRHHRPAASRACPASWSSNVQVLTAGTKIDQEQAARRPAGAGARS